MRRRIRFHPDFKKDLNAQLRWLAANRDDQWIKQLQNGIDEAIRLLSEFPAVGTIERQEGTSVLRRLILRRLPYVIWFVNHDEPKNIDVWLLRLFHARQNRPVPALPPTTKKK